VRASIEHVFAHLAHPEHLPRYTAPLWMTVDVEEKRGSAQIVGFRGYFIGLPIESVQRVVLRPPFSLEMTQIRGSLRSFVWRCTLKPGEDGTEVVLRVEADPAIPLIGEDAARQFLIQHLERTLDRIKLAAERRIPARRAVRISPGPPGPAPPDEAEPDSIVDQTGAGPAPHEAPAGPEPQDARPQEGPVHPPPGRVAHRSETGAEAKPAAAEAKPAASTSRHRRRRRRRQGGSRPPSGQAPRRQPPASP
jgi:Polyketide cyclase / dehydrase and lipid transport